MTRVHKLRASLSRVLPAAGAAFLMLSMLLCPSVTGEAVRSALLLCTRAVIPSLFPFFAASGLFLSYGGAQSVSRLFDRPLRRFFRLGGGCGAVIIAGAVCGCPVGAKCAAELYADGGCTRDEAERLIAMSDSAGPAFLIGGVGGALLGDAALGVKIYAAQLAASLICGWALRFTAKEISPRAAATFPRAVSPRAVADSLASAARTMLTVCASVVFFGVLTAFCDATLLAAGAADSPLGLLLCALLELSAASERAAAGYPAAAAAVIIAGAAGWTGLSVHAQVAAVCGEGLSLRRYFAVRVAATVLSALLAAIIIP